MAKVMSPLAPIREGAGAKAALKFYSLFMSYTPHQVIESSENLYWYLCRVAGYEFASGFRNMSTTIALSRTLKDLKKT